MKKYLLFGLIVLFSFRSYAQTKLEEVTLKNGSVVVLYDNGFWIYKEKPITNTIAAGTERAVSQLSSFQLVPDGNPVLYIENGEKVKILSRYNSDYWKVEYKGRIGYVRDIFFTGPKATQPAPSGIYTSPQPAKSTLTRRRLHLRRNII